MRGSPARAFAAVAAVAAGACEGAFTFAPGDSPTVATVIIAPDSARLVTGETLQLTVTARDSTGAVVTGRPTIWTSTNHGAVIVSPAGSASAVAPGEARIVATIEGRADTVPITVVALVYRTLSAGEYHSCALANDGRIFCWGFNLYGQVGGGFASFLEERPVPVSGPSRYRAVAIGGFHSCGIATDSVAACWGRNHTAQLGRGSAPGDPFQPAAVAGNLRAAALAAGEEHGCALTAAGAAWCWGGNIEGQLGDSQPVTRDEPAAVAGGHRFLRLAAGGFHSCAVGDDGGAWCWGANARGQLGDSSAGGNRRYPVRVRWSEQFTAVAAGGAHACGIAGGRLVCWGDNSTGQLGTGQADSLAIVPAPVAGALPPLAVAAGGRHSCALAADSTAHCWGANDRGQLGDGSTADRAVPAPVAGGFRFRDLAAGRDHTCGITTLGTALCWGAGTEGQLGAGGTADSPLPVTVGVPARAGS